MAIAPHSLFLLVSAPFKRIETSRRAARFGLSVATPPTLTAIKVAAADLDQPIVQRETTRAIRGMKIMRPHRAAAAFIAALLLAPASNVSIARAELSEAGKEAMTKAGKIMFEHRCRSCHADDPSKQSYGPSLVGVVGRKAGAVEGFAYSDALKASDIVWTEAALKAWMADNKALMPGTRMRHVGITDVDEQDFIMAYLRSLK